MAARSVYTPYFVIRPTLGEALVENENIAISFFV